MPSGKAGLRLNHDIWAMLPATRPGLTINDILYQLKLMGSPTTRRTLGTNLHILRCANSLRDDGRVPRHYWRGPLAADPKPFYRAEARPVWTYPDRDLLAECREGRREIRGAMRR